MNSDYYIKLHFNQAIAQKTNYAFKVGDKGCTFHLHCEDHDPTDMLPHIVFNRSDGTCVEGTPTGSGRDYTYTVQGNEFGVCGKTVVDLKFYDADPATQRISTASFIIDVIPDTLTPFDTPPSPYADSLERAKEELEDATEDLANMDSLFAQTLQDYIDAFGNTAPINPRGAYDPNELYKPRDAVYYTSGGKTLTYLNNLECTGVDPTNTSNWQPIIDITGIPAIIDNCTSTSTTDALSANQGRVLSEELSHRNLLDNGWFTVNQRGASSYSTAGNYTADRWYLPFGGLTVGISSSGATLTATADTVFYQKFETDELKGKTVTLSIKHFDGTIEHGTVQFPTTSGNNVVTITGGELQANVDTYGNCYFRIYIATGNTITARAVKLELGSVSTLHLDVAPDYTSELLKCQRYFERVKLLGNGNSQSVIGIGYAVSATVARITIPAKGKRVAPTITYSGSFTLHDGSAASAISYEEMTDNGVVVNVTSSGLTSGNIYLLRVGNTSYYIDFSADL